jgi:hypothetical protein
MDSRVRRNDGENGRQGGPSGFSISEGQMDIFFVAVALITDLRHMLKPEKNSLLRNFSLD